MASKLNEIITGNYDHVGESIIYGDTDSTMFSAWPIIKNTAESWNKDIATQLYDTVSEEVNSSFPALMETAFHCPRKNGEIIKAGREYVADRGLFITKKRYAVNIYDKEGKRLDSDKSPGKIKAMGLDLKRADTPKYIQQFLMRVLEKVLGGKEKEEIISDIRTFKEWLAEQPAWTKGSPKAVNNLTAYSEKESNSRGKTKMPGHVRASLNWNKLRVLNNDNMSMKIVDGAKVVVCQMKNNPMNFTSVAYPVDEPHLPQWFKDLPFDELTMETTLVDEKIDNLIGVLNWNIENKINTNSAASTLFTFG